MPKLSTVRPDQHGVALLVAGTTYTLAPMRVTKRLEYKIVGAGEVTFDGGNLGDACAFDVQVGGSLIVPPGVNWVLNRNSVGVNQYAGSVHLNGKGRNRWNDGKIEVLTPGNTVSNTPDADNITRVGQLIVVKQGDATTIRGYTYTGRPNKYVAFIGNPLELAWPPRTGAAKRVIVEHLVSTHSSHNEALVRWMHGFGIMQLCKLDNRRQQSPGVHKAALQPRGTHILVAQCEILGSIHAGPLDAAKETDPNHAVVQPLMPPAYLHVSNCAITGYIEVASGITAAFRNVVIGGQDPRAPTQLECIRRKKSTNKEHPIVCASNVTGSGFARLTGNGVKEHDDKLLREIFSNAAKA